MAGARGSEVSVDLGCNHDSGDSDSVAQQVFKQLDKNPLLTAKPLCQILRLQYRDRGHYVRNLKTKWKYHHRNERGSIRSLPDSVHNAFWVGVLPGGLESGIRAHAVGCGWLLSRARNQFLLWRDSFGRALVRKHTVETGWSILSENERRELKHSARWSNRLK